ncbi:hypothetical protein Tco_0807609 [Tanacetum coccineum]
MADQKFNPDQEEDRILLRPIKAKETIHLTRVYFTIQKNNDGVPLWLDEKSEELEEEALVEFMVELFEEDEDGLKNEKDGLFNLKASDQSGKA